MLSSLELDRSDDRCILIPFCMSLQLTNHDRVIILGGGPAGCFAGLHLLEFARQKGITLEILIFEPRDFAIPGPRGCNRCAGILSSRLIRGLKTLGVTLPPEVIRSEIHAYCLHVGQQVLYLKQPDPERTIISVYRAAGPRLGHHPHPRGFDDFLLDTARQRGIIHRREVVHRVTWAEKPIVHTQNQSIEADLLVLATGVNSRPPLDETFGYQPPRTATMVQDEFLTPPDWPVDEVHVYFQGPPGLKFGALIPKGAYINVSLLGDGLRFSDIRTFLQQNHLDAHTFSVQNRLCGCAPKIAIAPARCYYGHRWVAVGDAAITRLYKDGIGSAFFTAQKAMETAVFAGISASAFDQHYRPYCQRTHRDNRYGKLLIALWEATIHIPILLHSWIHAVHQESAMPPDQRIQIRILWGMLTGDEDYRSLFWLSLTPKSFINLGHGLKQALGGHHEPIIGAAD